MKLLALPLCLLALCVLTGHAQQSSSPYRVLKTIEVGGEGSWDYLTADSDARRLYITRGSHVMVMDLDSGKIVGDILNTKGVHGVALAPKLKRGYTSNGADSTVTVFDIETLKETNSIKVGTAPDVILYDPFSNRVFTFNVGSKDSSAIDVTNNTVVGNIALSGRPEAAVADGKGMIYVDIQDKNEIVAFDAKDLKVKHRWTVTSGGLPTGLAIDRAKRRLFASCRNEKMVILEADTGKVLASLPIGKGTDACVFDNGVGFSSNKDGTLTVVDEPKDADYRVWGNVNTQRGAKTMAVDTKNNQLYLATARFEKSPDGKKDVAVPGTFVILVVGK